jgi:hypothetical protein
VSPYQLGAPCDSACALQVDAAGPSISSGVLAAIQLSALPNDPDTTLPAPAEGTFSHALLNPVAVAMRDVDKPEYQPTTIAQAYGGTEHMKPGPDGFAVETNPRAPQDNIQAWPHCPRCALMQPTQATARDKESRDNVHHGEEALRTLEPLVGLRRTRAAR